MSSPTNSVGLGEIRRWLVSEKWKAKKKGSTTKIAISPKPGRAKAHPARFDVVSSDAVIASRLGDGGRGPRPAAQPSWP